MFLDNLLINKNYQYIYYYEPINLINNYYNFFFFIKYCFFIILIFFLFFFKYIFIIINKKTKIEIDNNLEVSLFENNIDFSNYSYDIKSIVFFYPEFVYINNSNNNNIFNKFYNYIKHKKISKYKKGNIFEIIRNNVDLAKRHGIYGLAIYYNMDHSNKNNEILNILIDKEIKFPFFLIWDNKYIERNILNNNYLLYKQKLYKRILNIFIKNIKEYLVDEIYIKINNKPVISINQPSIIPNLKETIFILRERASSYGVGQIFIFAPLRNKNETSEYSLLFDSAYDLSKIKLFEGNNLKPKNLYYAGIIYKNCFYKIDKFKNNFLIYRTSILEPNTYSKKNKLKNFSPEKFYLLNKILFEWTKTNYNKNDRIIFINSWNNYNEGNYLEPDKKYGYASINSFSKALFNLPYKENNNYSLIFLNKNCYVAIQAHIFYEELINEIINKTNNIPIKFDLYITTIELKKKMKIEKYVKNYSKANKYEIKIVENRGRDVLPLIIQLRKKIKKYKYFCHIHTKKSKHFTSFGNKWRNYLYKNLLGSKEVISEILNDFELFDKLGFIFPELYYNLLENIDDYYNSDFIFHRPNNKHMNFILKSIFPKFQIGNRLNFPSGDMFWAKVNAVHQIFKIRFFRKFPKELNQTNDTIMHGIERIWLYLVKLNGYYFKIIFKYY